MPRLSLDSVHQRVYPIADLLVSRHPLIGSLFINHSKDQTYLRTAEVITLYVAVLPLEAAASEPNRWILVLRTSEQTTATVELKQADPLGNTVVCCSDGPRLLETGELEGCVKNWAFEVQKGSSLHDWLDRLVKTGLTRYRLVGGLGEILRPFARSELTCV